MTDAERPAALYRLFDSQDRLLYVGVANRVDERWSTHAGTKRWWHEVTRKEVEWHPSKASAMRAEAAAVHDENPLYNIVLPDLDGSGRGRIRYDAPPIAWSRGDPNYRSKYRLRREAKERAQRAAAEAHD